MAFSPNAETVYADGPFGSPLQPSKPEIRSLLAQYEAAIDAYSSGAGSIAKSSRALLFADLAHAADVTAWVYADSTVAFNGIYRKSGASGAGSWTLILPLPFSFIIASDVGAGTPNAIQATTSIPVSNSALIWMNVFEANTTSPVTVSFNGGSALTIKTNTGNNVAAGGLVTGMIVLGIVSGATFRLVSDQASASIVAAAEAAQAAAEVAQAAAEVAADEAEAAQAAAQAAAAGVDLPPVAANRMLVDNAAGTARESKTFSDVRALLDPVTTTLFGAGSLARSLPARFSDTVNLRDWFDRTGTDGTATANNTALAALITYLTANPQVRTLKGNKGDVYRTTAFGQILPNGVRLMMDGARFRWSGLQGGTTGAFLSVGSDGYVQGMGIDIVAASTFRRFFQSESNTKIFDSEIIAESQINNYGGSLLDWAVRVYRSNNKIDGLKIVNVDKAFFAYGADGDGVPGLDNHFEGIRVESYVTGICLRNLAGARMIAPYVKTKSANALEDPGHNGILHEGVADYLLANAQVADSGEHGIRFGGTRNAEQFSRKIMVSNAQILRAGQTGFKMFTGFAGQYFENVNVSNVQVVDCQYNGPGGNEAPGFNDEGFLLQQVRKGNFTGLSVERQENTTFSCMDGVYISGADNLRIYGLAVQDPKRNAVRISEWDDGQGVASVETLANNEVYIKGLHAENVGEHGAFINHPTQSVRDINIEGEMIGNGAAGFYAFSGDAAIGRYVQPCLFQAKVRNFAAGFHNLPGGANVKTRDMFGSTY